MQTSIINYSETISVGRLDAEFFHPKYQLIENLIKSHNFDLLGNLLSVFTDFHANGSYKILKENVCLSEKKDYSYYLRTKELENLDFDNDVLYVSESAYHFLKKTKLHGHEIVINKIGNASKVYQVPMLNKPMTLGMNLFMIKPKEYINTHYLYIYLISYHGRSLIERRVTGAVPPSIDKESVRQVLIPLFSEKFQKNIEDMVLEAHAKREEAIKLTKEAQTLLEKELDIYEWTPTKQALNISIKKYSDTTQANRIDAEYYQEKYEAILNKIISYKGGCKYIHEVCTQNKDTFKISKDKEYQYVEIGSINTGSGDITSNLLLGSNLPANCKRVLYKDDILISKVRPYRGAISIVEQDGYVGSGAFTVLKMKTDVNKETVYTFLRLPIMLKLSLKPSTGTSYPVIIDEDVLNTVIPIIDKNIQDIIADKITSAHQARQESKRLLELAKSSVEHAIEHGE